MFGLEELGNKLTGAVARTGDTKDLAGGIAAVLLDWLGSKVWSVFSGFLIFAVVLFVFYGAFLYFTAYGDENKALLAKKTLTYAFIGLIIALTAFAATSYVQRIIILREADKELIELQQHLKVPAQNPAPK